VKERLAPKIVLDRYGWRPETSSRLLVVLDGATNRRRVALHDASLATAFPGRGVVVRDWLRVPAGRLSGLRFFAGTNDRGTRQARRQQLTSSGIEKGSGSTGILG